MKNAPIALFVYKRPEHTKHTLEALIQCPEFSESKLFVFCDGAKHTKDEALVQETRSVVRSLVGDQATIIESPHNQGLANSIIAGVTRLVNEFGQVIVLEDDLVVSPGFLNYMNQALEKYRDEERVMQVSGYMFPVPEFTDRDEAMFLPFTASWGWATWKRAWQKFDPEAKGWEVMKHDRQMRKRFNLNGAYNYFSMMERQFRGECDSWAIRWYWSVFQNNGLTVFPAQTLVENFGFDGSGTHGSFTKFKCIEKHGNTIKRIRLPSQLCISQKNYCQVQATIRKATPLWLAFIKLVVATIQREFLIFTRFSEFILTTVRLSNKS